MNVILLIRPSGDSGLLENVTQMKTETGAKSWLAVPRNAT